MVWDIIYWTVMISAGSSIFMLALSFLPGHLYCWILNKVFGWHFVKYREWPLLDPYKWSVARVRSDAETGHQYINTRHRYQVRLSEDGRAGSDIYKPITWNDDWVEVEE